jgi:P pilus assembly protein, chaperone PapD
MHLNISLIRISAFLLGMTGFTHALAGIILERNRIIFLPEDKDVTLTIRSKDHRPLLIQSWIDTGDMHVAPDAIRTPFLILPPITRLNPDKSAGLRIILTDKAALPQDRESVFWLNVLEIPPLEKPEKNNNGIIQNVFRTRIKVFYRPEDVAKEDKEKNVCWNTEMNNVVIHNNSPFFISVLGVVTSDGNRILSQDNTEMIYPFSENRSLVKRGTAMDSLVLDYLDDIGNIKSLKVKKC